MLLEVSSLGVSYGKVQVLHDIDLTVGHEIVTVVGANGAGKTTLLRAISGMVGPSSGSIVFDGTDVGGRPAHKVVTHGIVHVPEGRHVFPGLTVDENLDMGAFLTRRHEEREAKRSEVFELFPRLRERRKQQAGTLSGGEQQMLAIARGLMANPRLLLLDEPSLGLAPAIVKEIARTIGELKTRNIAVLLVEQDARMALRISARAYVFVNGRVQMTGPSDELAELEAVRAAYMGG
jgi:branched-chain amino acid transport system ATP-binding protein